jgi:large subunit ribosomal protein L17
LPRFGVRLADGEPKKIDLVEKVFVDLAKRFKGRPGGYTRIVKLGPRRGDNASMSIIELVGNAPKKEAAPPATPETKGKKKATGTKATAAATSNSVVERWERS